MENIVGNEMIYYTTLNDYGEVRLSCTIYRVFLFITF